MKFSLTAPSIIDIAVASNTINHRYAAIHKHQAAPIQIEQTVIRSGDQTKATHRNS